MMRNECGVVDSCFGPEGVDRCQSLKHTTGTFRRNIFQIRNGAPVKDLCRSEGIMCDLVDGYFLNDECMSGPYVYSVCEPCSTIMTSDNDTHWKCPSCGGGWVDTIGTNLVAWRSIAAEMMDRALRSPSIMTSAEVEFFRNLCDGQVMEMLDEIITLRAKVRRLMEG